MKPKKVQLKRLRRMKSKILIKIGGSTVNSSGLLNELGKGINALVDDNHAALVVHGGGKDIAKELTRLNREFTFVEGMRVTDAETMEAVQRVLSGDVNKRIVNNFISEGVKAIGISGVDGALLTAEKLLINGADIGFVGEVKKVDTTLLDLLYSGSYVPVLSPVSGSVEGDIYNVNADLAASEVAIAEQADDLIFISDVPGVLINDAVRKDIHIDDIETLIDEGHITGGMIPKLRSAADAIRRGVTRVHICGWRGSETIVEEIDSNKTQGTTIHN